MKLITAVIKPFRLDDIRATLLDRGLQGITLTEVKGFGRQKSQTELYRSAEYTVNFQSKARIDVAVDDEETERAIDTVTDAARTGKSGMERYS